MTGIEGGDITIEVWPEGFAETIHALGKVDGGETLKDVVIRVDTGATLTGRVLDATGGGVSGAQLFVGDMPQDEWERDREKRTMTSADGSYELGALPAGTVTVQVFHPSYVPASRQTFVSPGAVNREDIVMSNGGTITGRVTVSGKPASGQNFSYSFGQQHERVQTTAGGEYRIGGLPDGMVNLNPYVLTPDGAFRGKTAQVTVTDGTITEMDFDFVDGTSTAEGTAYSALGTPVGANVRIRIEILDPSGATDYFHTQTDASGRYMIGFVPAGQASLTASIPGDTEKNLTLSVGEGQRIQQDVHL